MMAKKARTALKQLLFVLVALAALAAIEAFDQDAFEQSAEEFCVANDCGLTSEAGDVNFRRELAVKKAPPPKRRAPPPHRRRAPPPRKPKSPPPKPKSPPPKPKSPPPKPKSPPPKPKSPPPKPKSPPPKPKSPPPPPPAPLEVAGKPSRPPPSPVLRSPPPPPPSPVLRSPPPPSPVLRSPPPPPPSPVLASPPPPPPPSPVLASPPPPPPPSPVLASPPPPPPSPDVPPPPPNPYPTSSQCPVLGTAVYPPSKLARWDKHYMNNWTPVDPPGGLVISDNQLHVDMKITSQNQIFGAFLSQKRFIYGYYDIWIKLIPQNSAGIAMTYYFTSPENHTVKDADGNSLDTHDELDFEFLGNVSGEPITLQTNMHVNGKGNREVRHSLPFDPTADFHKYSLLWNQHIIIWYADDSVIRVHHNYPDVPFPHFRPMAVHTSLWNASSWATRGGQDKLDLAYQPFILQFEGFDGVDGCPVCQTGLEPNPDPNCPMDPNSSYLDCSSGHWWNDQETLTAAQWEQLQCHQQYYVIYHYCYDKNRFTNWTTGVVTMPPECKHNEQNYTYPN